MPIVSVLQERHRGGAASDARKVFAFGVCRVYCAPVALVRSFLGVGGAAVSAMALQGRETAEKYGMFK